MDSHRTPITALLGSSADAPAGGAALFARRPAARGDLAPAARRVLRALFELAQADRSADASALGRLLGLRAAHVAESLVELDTRGLVRAECARLTLLGLGVAARLAPLELGGLERAAAAVAPCAQRERAAAPNAWVRAERARSSRARSGAAPRAIRASSRAVSL